MSRLMISSDLHLGHKNVCRFRKEFSSAEEHNEILFDNLASNIRKNDSLVLLGDVAFDHHWNYMISTINCKKKTLIVGNHDTEYIHMKDLVETYDQVHSLWSKNNYWFSHCPIHPQEMRQKKANIHGHLHFNQVWKNGPPEGFEFDSGNPPYLDEIDQRYFNSCVEHTEYKPISFGEIMEIIS